MIRHNMSHYYYLIYIIYIIYYYYLIIYFTIHFELFQVKKLSRLMNYKIEQIKSPFSRHLMFLVQTFGLDDEYTQPRMVETSDHTVFLSVNRLLKMVLVPQLPQSQRQSI